MAVLGSWGLGWACSLLVPGSLLGCCSWGCAEGRGRGQVGAKVMKGRDEVIRGQRQGSESEEAKVM